MALTFSNTTKANLILIWKISGH